MRLRGGKVLIDSDYKTNVSNYKLSLNIETTKAIIEKGLSIIVIEYVENVRVCVDLIPKDISDGVIQYNTISNDDGNTIVIELSFDPDFSNGLLTFTIQ